MSQGTGTRAKARASQGTRPIKPSHPCPCLGCGRTARRMIRVRELEITRDMAGAELGRRWRTWMRPYCNTCTP